MTDRVIDTNDLTVMRMRFIAEASANERMTRLEHIEKFQPHWAYAIFSNSYTYVVVYINAEDYNAWQSDTLDQAHEYLEYVMDYYGKEEDEGGEGDRLQKKWLEDIPITERLSGKDFAPRQMGRHHATKAELSGAGS